MKKLTLLSIFITITLTISFSQSSEVDAWEKKINEERQPPEKVMNAIGLTPGMNIGEIGCGRGRYTVHLAKRVGKKGKVFANDIDKEALDYLEKRIKQNKIKNIETILGKVDDPLLPPKKLDMVIMVWVYHMLDKPIPILKKIKQSLKPGATLVILDPPDSEINAEMKEMGVEIDPERPMLQQRIEHGAMEAGFELIKVDNFLPKDVIYILKVKNSD